MSRTKTIVATEVLVMLCLGGLIGLAYGIERVFGLTESLRFGPVASVALAICPAMLWLGYFYSQDRHEPEPKHFVLGIFLLGAFVSAPCAGFLVDLVVGNTMTPATAPTFDPFSTERLLYTFGVVGLSQELCKYAVVRYSIYSSSEFDEPMDGVIYMTAAGIGFAAYENFKFLQGHRGEVFLSAGVGQVVVTTLAHACFAGVLGACLGSVKFFQGSALSRNLRILGGLSLAVILNGGFGLMQDTVTATGFATTPWRGVAFTFAFAAICFIGLSLIVPRLLAASPHREP